MVKASIGLALEMTIIRSPFVIEQPESRLCECFYEIALLHWPDQLLD
jgi:hypothetical protein